MPLLIRSQQQAIENFGENSAQRLTKVVNFESYLSPQAGPDS